jgi:heme-degrading monooxygenase HmoA
MSVLVIASLHGDQEKFKNALATQAGRFQQIAANARTRGAIHHEFGLLGTDGVLVSDEWESAEKFQQFFADPSLTEFLAECGWDGKDPDLLIAEAVSSPDKF